MIASRRFGPTLALVLAALGLAFHASAEGAGKRYAILIGVNDYIDTSILKLNTPRNDAKDLGALLSAPGSGWSKVFVMTDDLDFRSPDCPLRSNIEKRVGLLSELAGSQDTVLLFLSGHGVSDSGGEALYLPLDADLNRLKETSISIPGLVKTLSDHGLTKIVLAVDACRESIGKTKGLAVRGVAAPEAGQGGPAPMLAFYATKQGWFSYEDEGGKNGVFTKFLLDGLGGAADANKDGLVGMDELAAWLPAAVGDYAIEKGIRQKPVVLGSGRGLEGIKAGLASGPRPGASAAAGAQGPAPARSGTYLNAGYFAPSGIVTNAGNDGFIVDKATQFVSDGVFLATKAGELGDFTVEATIQSLEGPKTYGNGLIFRAAPEGKGFLFNVTADGRFAFYEYDIPNDGYSWFRVLRDQTIAKVPDAAIRADGPNTLKAVVQGTVSRLYINGIQVASFDYRLNDRGFVGVYVSGGNKVKFTALRIE